MCTLALIIRGAGLFAKCSRHATDTGGTYGLIVHVTSRQSPTRRCAPTHRLRTLTVPAQNVDGRRFQRKAGTGSPHGEPVLVVQGLVMVAIVPSIFVSEMLNGSL
jgi:hypothetical protein